MIKSFFFSVKENKEVYFLAFLLAGYVLICSTPSLFGLSSTRYISVPYRVLVFLFAAFFLYDKIRKKEFSFKKVIPFLFFFGFYFSKLLFSFHNHDYNEKVALTFNEIYTRCIVIIFVPCLALLSLNYTKINLKLVVKFVFYTLFCALLLNFLYTVFYLNQFDKISGVFSVYYITSGHYGTSLVVLSIYFFVFKLYNELRISLFLLLLAVLLGLFAIFISAARSPLLALVLITLYFVILKKEYKYFYLFVSLSFLGLFFIYVAKQFFNIESAFVERNYVGIFEGNTSGREPYLARAITIFNDNWLFGDRVLYEDGMYPHNIFLEILMSGGVILLILFLLFFKPLIQCSKKYFLFSDSKKYIFPFFFFWLQYFILVQTSYNIYSNPEFWYFSALIIGISLNLYNEKIKSNDGCGNTTRDY